MQIYVNVSALFSPTDGDGWRRGAAPCLHNSWGYLHKLRTKISVATGYLDISKLIIVTKLPEAITGENEAENCAAIIVLSFQGYPAAS